jgi:beta-fructofuranosidase
MHFGSHRLQHNEEINFSNVSTNCCEALFKILINDAKRISIDVLCSPDRQEFTRITFYVNGGFNDRFRSVVGAATDANHLQPTSNDSVVTIDSSNSSILSDVSIRPPESASIRLHSDEILDVRVFIDRSVVEVFIDDQQCLAVRVYPSLVASTGMSVIGLGGTAELVSLDIWEMRSIY